MNIGYHIPFEGFYGTLNSAKVLGLPTFQMFIRNNRNLSMRNFTQGDFNAFNTALSSSGIDQYVVHASYAINPASGDETKRRKTVDVIKKDLTVLQNLSGYKHYVLHPGCYTEWDRDTGIYNLFKTLKEVLPYTKGTKLCIETMAGEGTELIASISEILTMCYMCKEFDDFALCLDTCHLFGAGIKFTELVDYLDKSDNLKRIGVVHVNGSKKPFGSRRDNHGNLQSGYLDINLNVEALNLLNSKGCSAPVILESEASFMESDLIALKSLINF